MSQHLLKSLVVAILALGCSRLDNSMPRSAGDGTAPEDKDRIQTLDNQVKGLKQENGVQEEEMDAKDRKNQAVDDGQQEALAAHDQALGEQKVGLGTTQQQVEKLAAWQAAIDAAAARNVEKGAVFAAFRLEFDAMIKAFESVKETLTASVRKELLDRFELWFQPLKEEYAGFKRAVESLKVRTTKVEEGLAALVTRVDTLDHDLRELIGQVEARLYKSIKDAEERLGDRIEALRVQLDLIRSSINEARTEYATYKKTNERIQEKQKRLEVLLRDLQTPPQGATAIVPREYDLDCYLILEGEVREDGRQFRPNCQRITD